MPGGEAKGRCSVLDFKMQRIDGTEQSLADYRGKVLMLVNVASKCGQTPQYEVLERVYEQYRDRGFEILGFPANDFNEQEPGTDDEIAQFCELTYGVKFPLFSKISVKGEEMHPLYQYLTTLPDPIGGDVRWNFQKYLVDKQGNVVSRVHFKVKADEPQVIEQIENLLNA